MNLKKNIQRSSENLLKCIIPEIDLDWGDVYFFIKDKTQNTFTNIKTITNYIRKK